MTCIASLVSISLAKDLLQRHSLPSSSLGGQGSKALVASTKTLTPNLHHSNERGFLLKNNLFTCGGV